MENAYVAGMESKCPTDKCWETGIFTDDCDCELCNHKHNCSGYEPAEDDDEQIT